MVSMFRAISEWQDNVQMAVKLKYINGCDVGSNYRMLRGLIQFARRPGMSRYRIAQSLAWRMEAPVSPTSCGDLAASPRSVISVISQLNRPWRRLFIRVLWKYVLWTPNELRTVGRHARLVPVSQWRTTVGHARTQRKRRNLLQNACRLFWKFTGLELPNRVQI